MPAVSKSLYPCLNVQPPRTFEKPCRSDGSVGLDSHICDPHRVDLSDALTTPQELSTIHVRAADAHYQLGKVEVNGGWFNQALEKTIHEFSPGPRMMVRMCVDGPLQKRIDPGVWPAQFVFGRNPKIPEHLMDEPLEVVPATAPLYGEEVARHVAVRHAARRAVLELQDSKALRLALAAKPRHQKEPEPAQLVAYWRTQKWEQGQLNSHGRWHGPAIVLGKVGRNFVVVHKRQVIRRAPERIRAASRQYFDLIPQGYPTEERPEAVPVEAPAQSEDPAPAMSLSDRLNAEPARPAAMAGPGVDDSAAPGTTTANAEPTDDVDPSNNHDDVRNDLEVLNIRSRTSSFEG